MNPVLELKDVSKIFRTPTPLFKRVAAGLRGEAPHGLRAVDRVSLSIGKGEVVGLVGESGCGKSTLGRVAARLLPASSGMVLNDGVDVTKLPRREARRKSLRTQMIFQNPFSSLNPRMRVRDIIGEAAIVHGVISRQDVGTYVAELLGKVGLDREHGSRLPHQFSGGQRQRIGIARALSVRPDLLVCDESVAALDVSIQAQILNLFMDLRDELGLTYLFISHDLSVIQHLCDRVVIMYLGRTVETAPTKELFRKPMHPYSAGLLASVPRFSEEKVTFGAIKGEIPSPINPPDGCHFHTRCPKARERCRKEVPALREIAPHRFSACHYAENSN